MVIICDTPFPNESKYDAHFDLFPYPLSDFQKYSIQAIVEGHHSLITAHTGSGKSLPAEFAIQYFTGTKKKKVIYTSPIKALSNQKYYEFIQKYPHISFGIMTGDIKVNPDADVLIMTTEILMNHLFMMNNESSTQTQTQLQFQMDINKDLACVVFDEIHYINDVDRGRVWEQTILMLPPHIQMIMLSATIDAPEKFAKWCEKPESGKQVYLSSTYARIVPLVHYGYLVVNDGTLKSLKDKETIRKLQKSTGTLVTLKSENGEFSDLGYVEVKRTRELLDANKAFTKRQHVLNSLAQMLRDREMLPAIAFVFSRKNVEKCAEEITVPLLEFDSKVAYTVKRECEQIIRKLPNYEEYLALPEYVQLVALLEKGIGIHHSGMIPVLREIVEFMISKRYIKLLFATESFAIGLNCPIRTAIFTSLTKFDGRGLRFLLPHEYNQAASRCGRRGIDTIGHVVHCNNLFDLPTSVEYKNMLCGKPQALVSKFRISFSIILNLMRNKPDGCTMTDFTQFVEKSMIQNEINISAESERKSLERVRGELAKVEIPHDILDSYLEMKELASMYSNKKRKDVERKLSQYQINPTYGEHYKKIRDELRQIESYINYLDNYVLTNVSAICDILLENRFITIDQQTGTGTYSFTPTGKIAAGIAEVHPLVMSRCLGQLLPLSPKQIIGVLSCFSGIKVDQDSKVSVPTTPDKAVKAVVSDIAELYKTYGEIETKRGTDSGVDYDDALIYDAIDIMMDWCDCTDEAECRIFIRDRVTFSIGEFTKGIMKISAVVKELMGVCESVELAYKLSQVDGLILKYVATAQSLYV
jgi:superfamily II RNA helicase